MKFKLTRLVVLTCLAVVASVFCCPGKAAAGQLDDFEYQATKPAPEQRHHEQEHDDDDFLGSCIGGFFSEAVQDVVASAAEGIQAAGAQPRPKALPGLRHRPMVRFDYGYQNVESDVRADDFRLELGLEQIAMQVRTTHYREASPSDDLDLTEGHFLYRIAGQYLDVDLGIGAVNLEGNGSHTGASFTLPLALHANDYLSVEFKPAWGFIENNTISDYDLALSCGWQYVALRGGYRWLRAHDASLDGPYLGLSLRY